MRKEIVTIDNRITVFIKDDDDNVILVQPFNPTTGLPFKDELEANQWADDMIALMVPPETTETTETTESTESAESTEIPIETTETTENTTQNSTEG